MKSFEVVFVNIALYPLFKLGNTFVVADIDIAIFESSEKSLDCYVVNRPSFSVHRYLYAVILEQFGMP